MMRVEVDASACAHALVRGGEQHIGVDAGHQEGRGAVRRSARPRAPASPMPPIASGLPARRQAVERRARCAARIAGARYSPGTPSSALRSLAPMPTRSTPGTAAIAARLSMPRGDLDQHLDQGGAVGGRRRAPRPAGAGTAAVGKARDRRAMARAEGSGRPRRHRPPARGGLDARRDDAHRAAVEQAADDAVVALRAPHQRHQPRSSAQPQICAAASIGMAAVLEVDPDHVVPAGLGQARDLRAFARCARRAR